MAVGKQLNELNSYEIELCNIAIKFIKQTYRMLTKKQVKDIWAVKLKMDKYISSN